MGRLRRRIVLPVVVLGSVFLAACTSSPPSDQTSGPSPTRTPFFDGATATPDSSQSPTPTVASPESSTQPTPTATSQAEQAGVPPELIGPVEARALTSDERPSFSTAGWKTNWKKRTVNLGDIFSGGPPRDGIPPIYEPKSLTIPEAEDVMIWLTDKHPVLVAEVSGDAKAYPLGILTYHEIVNDRLGGEAIAVTYCPLCNSGIGFKRTVNGHTLQFGTSGNLYNSNLVMWDRTTESWWAQLTREAIVGEAAGLKLEPLPVQLMAWKDYKEAYPDGLALSSDTGNLSRLQYYGTNPYERYDAPSKQPFLFFGSIDPRLPAMERVVAVEVGGGSMAFPYSVLRNVRVVNFSNNGEDIVVLFKPGTASALDAGNISESKDVGSAAAFSPVVKDQRLTFTETGNGVFIDDQTGSTWNIAGQAVDGPLKGAALEAVLHDNPLWFSWSAFKPDVRVYEPPA